MSYPTPEQPVQPAQPYAPYQQQKSGTNVLSIIALVGAFVFPLAGVICGHIALSQIKRTGEQGRGLALAGLIIGYAYIAVVVLLVILMIVFSIIASATAASYSSY